MPDVQEEQPQTMVEPDSPWKYQSEGESPSSTVSSPSAEPELVTWSASEFINHEKPAGWYVIVIGISLILSAAALILIKDEVVVAMVLVVGILFVVAASRRPRTLDYRLDDQGITIGKRSFRYADFKSFSVVNEGAFSSIMLMPLKRYLPGLSLYFPPDQGQKIVQTISYYLPHEVKELDFVDKLMHRLHF